MPERRRPAKGRLTVLGAAENNLKGMDVAFPLGCFVAVTGVSGAGKSTLVNGILRPALLRRLHGAREAPGKHRGLAGDEQIDKVIDINQQPIGRTPRSNPATYTKLFDAVRDVFAQTPEARSFGYLPGRFSFNVKGGRCEACQGDGMKLVEMHFLADVLVPCEVCGGKRFNEATLRVTFKTKNIAEVLDLSVAEATGIFQHHREIARVLRLPEPWVRKVLKRLARAKLVRSFPGRVGGYQIREKTREIPLVAVVEMRFGQVMN